MEALQVEAFPVAALQAAAALHEDITLGAASLARWQSRLRPRAALERHEAVPRETALLQAAHELAIEWRHEAAYGDFVDGFADGLALEHPLVVHADELVG